MASAKEILDILDECCRSYTFPMLDNGYVYPAAGRLSAHHSPDNWALVFELFGYSPRAGRPDTTILTFAGALHERNNSEGYVSTEAYKNYLARNPHNEDRRVWPLADGDWLDSEDIERLSANPVEVQLRGAAIMPPPSSAYARHGIELSEPPSVMVFEFCRFLAAEHLDKLLATPNERRVSLDPQLREILVLDEWHHPDLAGGELASQSETFRQLAKVLSTGDANLYRPTKSPNNHWRNWPEGGAL